MSRHSHSKKNRAGQYVLSFLLFVMISVLSLSLCAKVYIANPTTVADMFCDKAYVTSLRADIVQYAKDECAKCSIPDEFIDSAISYDAVYEIEASYICSALGTSQSYSDEAYGKNVEALEQRIIDRTEKVLKNDGITTSVKNGSKEFAKSISSYVMQKTEFKYIDRLQTMLNLGNIALMVIIIVSGIFTVIFGAVLFFKNEKRYRSLRMISFSFSASALLSFAMVGAVGIIRAVKDLVIYPTYLCNAVMNYVNSSMMVVMISGIVWLFVSIVLTTIIWRLKRGDE